MTIAGVTAVGVLGDLTRFSKRASGRIERGGGGWGGARAGEWGAHAFAGWDAQVLAVVLCLSARDAARATVLARAGIVACLASPAAVGVGAINGALLGGLC